MSTFIKYAQVSVKQKQDAEKKWNDWIKDQVYLNSELVKPNLTECRAKGKDKKCGGKER